MTGLSVRRGDRITIRVTSGRWTADYRNMPMTGPVGYDADTDKKLRAADFCKVDPAAPFATLPARLAGKHKSTVHAVGRALTFKAGESGATLQLGMNDAAGACSQDNKGAMTIRVSVTHQP